MILSSTTSKFMSSLKLKADYNVRVVATEQLGRMEHLSSDRLYRHLCVLNTIIPGVGELYTKRNGHKILHMLDPPE